MSKTTKKELSLAEEYEIYKSNVTKGMIQDLAEELGPGITVEAIEELGAGYYPGDACWIFPERNAKGDIIGLLKRPHGGDTRIKHMVVGSKRGLIYAYNSDHAIGDKKYEAGKYRWINIQDQADLICPICASTRWCMVSADNPNDPSAVICNRISNGSVREMPGGGHLHILKQQQGTGHSILLPTELPTIITEGASDVLAAMSLGFTVIGRPSAPGGMAILKEMPLASKEIWVIGENDAGAGEAGMKKTYLNIKDITSDIKCILPPEGIKDLRQWVQRGLTQASLFEYVGKHGDDNKEVDPNVFTKDSASYIANRFLDAVYRSDDGTSLLRKFHGQWKGWNGINCYEDLDKDSFDGILRRFLENKTYQRINAKGIIEEKEYSADDNKVKNIKNALNMWVPIPAGFNPPCYLEPKDDDPDPSNLIIFNDGIFDVENYIRTGSTKLLLPDPRYFNFNAFLYNLDPEARSQLYEDTINEIFMNDVESIRLWHMWLGYNLVPDTTQEKLMILLGGSRSGKGTLIRVLESILGAQQCHATKFKTLAGQFALAPLVGKLAAILPDERWDNKTSQVALDTVLAISGRDSVPIRGLYHQAYSARLPVRFTIGTTELPGFVDDAKAFSIRSLILSLSNSFEGREDVTLKDRLEKEAGEGKLINYALRGLKDLREQGRFIMPESSKPLHAQLEAATAPVTTFVNECCTVDKKEAILKSVLFEAWAMWCSKTGHKVGNNIYFGRWLLQARPSVVGFQGRIDGKKQYVYRGIDLQDSIYIEYLGHPKNTSTIKENKYE